MLILKALERDAMHGFGPSQRIRRVAEVFQAARARSTRPSAGLRRAA